MEEFQQVIFLSQSILFPNTYTLLQKVALWAFRGCFAGQSMDFLIEKSKV